MVTGGLELTTTDPVAFDIETTGLNPAAFSIEGGIPSVNVHNTKKATEASARPRTHKPPSALLLKFLL
jgi:hypothetical protein